MIASRRFDQQATGLARVETADIYGVQVNGEPMARLVESSEADAYCDLIRSAGSENEDFIARTTGGSIVIVSPAVTTSLNLNRAIGVGVFEPAKPQIIDAIAGHYSALGLPFGIEIGPYAMPAELPEWLRARRLRRGMASAMVFLELDDATGSRSPSVEVHEAQGQEIELVAAICCEVFRMPEPCRRLLAGAGGSGRWHLWLATVSGAPAGAAMSFIGDSAAWLGWDATLPSFRGRGVQRSLIRRRLQDAAGRRCRFATAETGVGTPDRRDPSLRNYESEGFTVAYHRHTYVGLPRRPSAGIKESES